MSVCRRGVYGPGQCAIRGRGTHFTALQHAEETPGQVRFPCNFSFLSTGELISDWEYIDRAQESIEKI